jgi:hypothetical protein
LRGLDLNQGPSGYEPDELPDCSTPRYNYYMYIKRFLIIIVFYNFFLDFISII